MVFGGVRRRIREAVTGRKEQEHEPEHRNGGSREIEVYRGRPARPALEGETEERYYAKERKTVTPQREEPKPKVTEAKYSMGERIRQSRAGRRYHWEQGRADRLFGALENVGFGNVTQKEGTVGKRTKAGLVKGASYFNEWVLDQPPKGDSRRLKRYQQRHASQKRHFTQYKYGAGRSMIGMPMGQKTYDMSRGLGRQAYGMFDVSTFHLDVLRNPNALFNAPDPFGRPAPRRRRR